MSVEFVKENFDSKYSGESSGVRARTVAQPASPKENPSRKFLTTKDMFEEQVSRAQKWCQEHGHTYLFAALYGSQNYGLSRPQSDVDVKCAFAPSPYGLLLDRNWHTATLKSEANSTDSLVLAKDVRDVFHEFKKQNLHFLELLFSDYYDCNELYAPLFKDLRAAREQVAHLSPGRFLRATGGLATHLMFDLDHQVKAGEPLSRKQFAFFYYLLDVMRKYVEGCKFEDCMRCGQDEFLRKVKFGGGICDHEESCRLLYESVKEDFETFMRTTVKYSDPTYVDKNVDQWMDELLFSTLTEVLKEGKH